MKATRALSAISLIALLVAGGWFAYKLASATLKVTNGNLASLLTDAKLDGEASGRVNILLAGNSADDPGHGGADLTDSLMIVSLNTKDNTAYMLSIPRDTWVDVPGYGHEKINAAYTQGGIGLLEQVVNEDFGVGVNYYAVVDYTAFKQAVDAVGGITVNIQSSDPRGIYDPNIGVDTGGAALRLSNGPQTLDGQTALDLARARNDPTPDGQTGYGLPNGDFDRAANQRMILMALKAKVESASTLTNPVKITQLLEAVGNNVHTDFTAGDLRRLAELSQKIPAGSVHSYSLQDSTQNVSLLSSYVAPDGEDALVPSAGVDDFSQIQQYISGLQ